LLLIVKYERRELCWRSVCSTKQWVVKLWKILTLSIVHRKVEFLNARPKLLRFRMPGQATHR
jgi:hypothetical protein